MKKYSTPKLKKVLDLASLSTSAQTDTYDAVVGGGGCHGRGDASPGIRTVMNSPH